MRASINEMGYIVLPRYTQAAELFLCAIYNQLDGPAVFDINCTNDSFIISLDNYADSTVNAIVIWINENL